MFMRLFRSQINTLITLFSFFIVCSTNAQLQNSQQLAGSDINTITTAVPFLLISPDSRSGAMGDAGVAISPDANSVFLESS